MKNILLLTASTILILIILPFIVIAGIMTSPVRQLVNCKCGKVKLKIDSPSALRLVSYSKDYRGYYQTLNEQATSKKKSMNAALDPWGGVDLTQIYPSEITVKEGANNLVPALIREKSPIRRVYASCCDTPTFDIGNMAAMLNTDLLDDDQKPPVKFRIIGRQALKKTKNGTDTKPLAMSWSVPLSWFWTMPRRIDKTKMEPNPINLANPQVMQNFKEG